MEFGIEVLAWREGQVFQANGKEQGCRGQGIDEVTAIELVSEIVEDAGIYELFGVVIQLGGGDGGTHLESRRRQQLLVGILRVAFELNGLGQELLRGARQAGGEQENSS